MDETIKNKDMIGLIYKASENVLEKRIKEANKKIKIKIKDIPMERLLQDTEYPEELENAFNRIEENYSIKIAQYNEEFYRQGFIDGIHLMINCLKK